MLVDVMIALPDSQSGDHDRFFFPAVGLRPSSGTYSPANIVENI